jgi:hypothetical protein
MMLAIFDTVFVSCVGAAYSLPLLSHHWKVTTGNKKRRKATLVCYCSIRRLRVEITSESPV